MPSAFARLSIPGSGIFFVGFLKKRFKKSIAVFLLAIFFFFCLPNLLGNIFCALAATETDLYIGNEIWTEDNSPYIIENGGGGQMSLIPHGTTLTIEAGTVIKMSGDIGIRVEGKLIVKGTANKPVIFTSIIDNVLESNCEDCGEPRSGDWQSIIVEDGGELEFDHAIVRYGGHQSFYFDKSGPLPFVNTVFAQEQSGRNVGAIQVKEGAKAKIQNSDITNNRIGLEFEYHAGKNEVYIEESNIINNDEAGVKSYGPEMVYAMNNWWGHESGPNHVAQNPSGQGDTIVGNVAFMPFKTKAETKRNPVIIVPGIMGSMPAVGGEYVLDPILHTYDSLIEALIGAGYILNTDLFLFPYDWHASNYVTSADLLKSKINEIAAITDATKVDIVAHSMGGLVARYYVESSAYENDVDQLIFLNTPHNGAPESYLIYEGAYFLGGVFSKIREYAFRIEAISHGYLSLVEYIRNKVASVYQLLPTYDYLYREAGDEWWRDSYNPDSYPQNGFLEELNSEIKIDNLKNRVRVTNIYSFQNNDATITEIRVSPDQNSNDMLWQHGYPACIKQENNDCLEMGSGDGTVPMESLEFLEDAENIQIENVEHREIVTKAQKEVIKTLTGNEPSDYFSGPWSVIKRLLFIRVYSPVDFQVIAPDGKKIGKDIDNKININEIPGAYYSGFENEAEFVTIINPIDGEYKVLLEGIGNGEYKLGVDALSERTEGSDIENLVSGTVTSGDRIEYSFAYAEASDEIIEIVETDYFAKMIKDIENLYGQGKISKKMVRDNLVKELEKIKEKYAKIEEKKNVLAKKIIKLVVLVSLQAMELQIRFYESKHWITKDARDLLIKDFRLIINYIKV